MYIKPIPVSELARNLGVSRSFLYNEAARNRITLSKLGSRTVALPDEVQRYLNALPKASIGKAGQ